MIMHVNMSKWKKYCICKNCEVKQGGIHEFNIYFKEQGTVCFKQQKKMIILLELIDNFFYKCT